MWHRCRATPPTNFFWCRTPPPVPGGVALKFGSEKVSRYTGVSQLQLRVSCYTVQLRWGRFSGRKCLSRAGGVYKREGGGYTIPAAAGAGQNTHTPKNRHTPYPPKNRLIVNLSMDVLAGMSANIGCTPRGSCNRKLLRRVLRRFSNRKCFFLEGGCKGFSVKTRFLEGFLEGWVL